MKVINNKAYTVLDCTETGKVGTAMIVPGEYIVIASGKKGDGTLCWVTIESAAGPINIASVYAPNMAYIRTNIQRSKIELWEWMKENLPIGNWVLVGDWNMVD